MIETRHPPGGSDAAPERPTEPARQTPAGREDTIDLSRAELRTGATRTTPRLEQLIPEVMNIDPERHGQRRITIGKDVDSVTLSTFATESGLPMTSTVRGTEQTLNVGELLEKGYVFCNRICNGGRPIFGRVGNHDYTHKLFLKADELDTALTSTVPSALSAAEVRAVGADMDVFLSTYIDCQRVAVARHDFDPTHDKPRFPPAESLRALTGQSLRVAASEVVKFLSRAVDTKLGETNDILIRSTELAEEVARAEIEQALQNELKPFTRVRNIQVGAGSWQAAKNGVGVFDSPILCVTDEQEQRMVSAHRGIYLGVTSEDGVATLGRLNHLTAYLARYGISNTPDAQDKDYRYVTIEEYHRQFYPLRHTDPDVGALDTILKRLKNECYDALANALLEEFKPTFVERVPRSGLLGSLGATTNAERPMRQEEMVMLLKLFDAGGSADLHAHHDGNLYLDLQDARHARTLFKVFRELVAAAAADSDKR